MSCHGEREQWETAWWSEIFSGHGISKGLEVRLEVQHKKKGELTSSASGITQKKVAQRQSIESSLLKNRYTIRLYYQIMEKHGRYVPGFEARAI